MSKNSINELFELWNKAVEPKPPVIKAINKLIRPPLLSLNQRAVRKRNTPLTEDYMVRNCINCNVVLTYNDHSCPKCAVVQEDSWLVHPTIDEVR